MATVNGTSGNDFIHTGTDGLSAPGGYSNNASATDSEDTINSGGGGSDIIHAGDGNDVINFADDLDASDVIDGGAGFDTLYIYGQTDVTFAAGSLINVDEIVLPYISLRTGFAGFQNLTMNDANVAIGQTLVVDASALNSDTFFTFDGSAEKDGQFRIYGGHGSDHITGGAQNDFFDLTTGGNDTVISGGGLDGFEFGDTLTAADTVIGDAREGGDVGISGPSYAAGLTFSATMLQNVTRITLGDNYTYFLTSNDATVAAGKLLTVDASTLATAGRLVFDGSAETNGRFQFSGGAGNDYLIGGAKADTFYLYQANGLFGGGGYGGGDDVAKGGGGNDTFYGVLGNASIDGGAGTDTVYVSGVGAFGFYITMGPDTIHNVEKLVVGTLNCTMNDGNVAAGATLMVSGAPALFDGSAETDGHFKITQTAGDGAWIGGALSDTFDVSQGSSERVNGGGGADLIIAGALFDSNYDQFDGGAGADTLRLDGDYSLNVTFAAATLVNVETLIFAAGHSYNFTTDDATVAAGKMLTVDGSALGSADNQTFNGAAETDGRFVFLAGAGADRLTGGAGADAFDFSAGNLTSADTLAGGAGADMIHFTTAGTTGAGAFAHVTGIDKITLANGVNSLGLSDALVSSSDSHLLTVIGGSGADAINGAGVTTATNRLVVTGGGGADMLTAGAGADRFVFAAAGDSTSTTYDTVKSFNFAADRFDIPGAHGVVTGLDAALTTGTLNGGANFDAKLELALSGQLHAHHAILYTPDAGTLAGQTFLVVDLDGADGYLPGADLVIHLTGQTGTMTLADFI